MEWQQAWQEADDALEAMAAHLPELTEAQMDALCATGAGLPAVLRAAELQHAEVLESAILERWLGREWSEDLTPVLRLCLLLRFEWAAAVLQGVRRCGFGRPPDDLPYQLLVSSWDHAGFEKSHRNFLHNHFLAVLGDKEPGSPPAAGG